MNNALAPYIVSLIQSAEWFCGLLLVFLVLARFFPGKPEQPGLRRDMMADSVYWFFASFLYAPIFALFVTFLFSYAAVRAWQYHGSHYLLALPLVMQAFLILLITDFFQYWMHRLFHQDGLWKFHAIHHSSKNVDWLSSARFHPINIIFYSTAVNALVVTFGFDPAAFAILFPFNMVYSPLVHANLNWNYGPFKYVLASPVFHRWHHTSTAEGGNKNFAPTFPILDLMFGTFYMPKGVQPTVFGTPHDPIPDTFLGQMVYPFKKSP